MEVREFEPKDLLEIELHDSQAWVKSMFTPEYLAALPTKDSYTGLVDGKIVAICGVAEIWQGRAVCWAFFSNDAKTHMVFVTKLCRDILQRFPEYDRLEATVEVDFKEGQRWMNILDFEEEGILHKYFPNGNDAIMYARVK